MTSGDYRIRKETYVNGRFQFFLEKKTTMYHSDKIWWQLVCSIDEPNTLKHAFEVMSFYAGNEISKVEHFT